MIPDEPAGTKDADAFGAALVEAIMGTGLNEKTSAAVGGHIVGLLKSGRGFDDLYRAFAHADKVRSALIAWNDRERLRREFVNAPDKAKMLAKIRGIGKITATRLVERLTT